MIASDSESWMRYAACAGLSDGVMFPGTGTSPKPAKQVCARCPVQSSCLEYALAHKIEHGVWGGLTTPERRSLKKLGTL